jgi:hypothetical protein
MVLFQAAQGEFQALMIFMDGVELHRLEWDIHRHSTRIMKTRSPTPNEGEWTLGASGAMRSCPPLGQGVQRD